MYFPYDLYCILYIPIGKTRTKVVHKNISQDLNFKNFVFMIEVFNKKRYEKKIF